MAQFKKIVTVGGTVAAAIGIGVMMQTSAISKDEISKFQAPEAIEIEDSTPLELTNIVNTSALPDVPTDMHEIAVLPPMREIKAVAPNEATTTSSAQLTVPVQVCDIALEANPLAAAMVNLDLSAPCLPNERATLHHNGMMFSVVTDEAGAFSLQVPALAQTAVFVLAFSNGDGAVASAQVPSLEFYDRVVVQWRGRSGLQLHAREYGAQYGEEGHVWANSTRAITYAARGKGGALTRHGDETMAEALMAEVYSFPSGTVQRGGDIHLSVEAEITAHNCGRDVEAQTLQVSDQTPIIVQDLSLAIPDCDAIGDFLVLNNMLNDLTIARN